jgi:cyclase
MDRDGTKLGFDIPLTYKVAKTVRIPVIASGGCASPDHMLEVFQKTDASAALAASIFHFGEWNIRDVKTYLKDGGVNVRI